MQGVRRPKPVQSMGWGWIRALADYTAWVFLMVLVVAPGLFIWMTVRWLLT
jgi:hypothetical protein